MSELWKLTASELAAGYRAGRFTPVEATESVLERIADVDGTIHAFVTVSADVAREQAVMATERYFRGSPISALDGVPVSIKDLEPTRGIRTTYGSARYRDHVPDHDAVIVERLRGAGMVFIGKTNSPYLGWKDMTDNDLGPPTVNPWDRTKTSGGSSGGAAAAVALGMGPLATGGDGAGSIRIPSALCGVVGFKPTFGLIPSHPVFEPFASLSHKGPHARTVTDAVMMLEVVAGRDDRDPASYSVEAGTFHRARGTAAKGLRVGVSIDFGYAPVDPGVRGAILAAAAQLDEAGATVAEVDVGWSDPIDLIRLGWKVAYSARVGDDARTNPEWFPPELVEMVEQGGGVTAVEYVRYLAGRAELYHDMRRLFDSCDVLVCPTMPVTAWPIDAGVHRGPGTIEGVEQTDWLDRLSFTFPFNLTGTPAMSLPAGLVDGLPVGAQLVAMRWRDDLVIRAAIAMETVGHHGYRWPPDPTKS